MAHLQLKPRTPLPDLAIEFFPFAGLSHTARFHNGRLVIRLSDICMDAPEEVYESLALILLARLYRKKIDLSHHQTYRAFTLRNEIRERARTVRLERGREIPPATPKGRYVNLEETFDRLNVRYFGEGIKRPRLLWSTKKTKHVLGRYDALHNAIFISRVFDSPHVPSYVVDYIMFHEMLHIKHSARVHDTRLVVHTSEFRKEERTYAYYREAKLWLEYI